MEVGHRKCRPNASQKAGSRTSRTSALPPLRADSAGPSFSSRFFRGSHTPRLANCVSFANSTPPTRPRFDNLVGRQYPQRLAHSHQSHNTPFLIRGILSGDGYCCHHRGKAARAPWVSPGGEGLTTLVGDDPMWHCAVAIVLTLLFCSASSSISHSSITHPSLLTPPPT